MTILNSILNEQQVIIFCLCHRLQTVDTLLCALQGRRVCISTLFRSRLSPSLSCSLEWSGQVRARRVALSHFSPLPINDQTFDLSAKLLKHLMTSVIGAEK